MVLSTDTDDDLHISLAMALRVRLRMLSLFGCAAQPSLVSDWSISLNLSSVFSLPFCAASCFYT